MKKEFKILRTHAGKTGYVSVTDGVYSEGNITKWQSKIEIDGQWYDIPDHFDTHEYKNLIQGIELTGVVSTPFGGNECCHEIKSGLINRDNCVKVLWCDEYQPLNKNKAGDVFEYGIEIDFSKADARSLSKQVDSIGWKPKIKHERIIEEIYDFKIFWHQGINI